MNVRRIGVVMALVVGVTIAGTEPAGAAARIAGRGVSWNPARVTIDRGERVRWRAVSGNHTVRAYGGNWRFSKRIDQGEAVGRRFRQRGRYRFFCSIHGNVSGGTCTGMCGRVRVRR